MDNITCTMLQKKQFVLITTNTTADRHNEGNVIKRSIGMVEYAHIAQYNI